jgi:hypothetical protein
MIIFSDKSFSQKFEGAEGRANANFIETGMLMNPKTTGEG